jgi:lipopolysaccharide transport system permease protein
MQAGFFLTPVMYSMDTLKGIPQSWILKYNPMAEILDSMRYVLINRYAPIVNDLAYATVIALILVVLGWLIFSRLEPRFGEEV